MKYQKIIEKILSGSSDANINYDELCNLLIRLGFKSRQKGSHRIFYKENIEEMINLQSTGSQAKPYQIRQVRQIIIRYKLEINDV
jgi:predicted RNA binding protein YcfA (HicA-like mRNA interferase family)